jgi:Arc/MetJ family transcription regulator
MTTTLTVDDVLLERARRIGNLRTKKKTVTQALTECIQRRRQREILRPSTRSNFGRDGATKRTGAIANLVVDTSVWTHDAEIVSVQPDPQAPKQSSTLPIHY